MKKTLLISLLAGTAIVAGAALAFAEAPGGHMGWHPMSKEDRAAHHAEMCKDMYAHEVGGLAALEAKLSLTSAQEGAFNHWKDVKLGEAKDHSSKCASMTRPDMAGGPPSPLDHMAHEEEMLKTRLADLQAERPVLAAFYNSLNDTQKKEFAMEGRRMHAHMHGMHGMMMGHGSIDHGPDGDGDHDGPMDHDGPPPPRPQGE